MPDKKLIRDDRAQHEPHPVGQYVAVCVDFVDLGAKVEQFGQDLPVIKEKVAFVFRTTAQTKGKPLQITQEFTESLAPKSNLRRFLEAWGGRPYSNHEIREEGIALHALVGAGALLTIAHKQSQSGNTYAVITAIQALPAKMAEDLPSTSGYERAPFWEKRKQEYAANVAAFKPKQSNEFELPQDDEDEDEDLPF